MILDNLYYTQRYTSKYPGLFVFLIDQSGSMGEQVLNHKSSKAEVAAAALNTIIHELITFARFEETGNYIRKKNAYLSILGYNDTVNPLLYNTAVPTSIPYLAEHPLGFVTVVHNLEVSPSKFRQVQEKRPFWVEPSAQGTTQMAKAFAQAKDIVLSWLASPPEVNQAPRQKCFPPIIINITDAQHNGTDDLIFVSHEIQNIGTQQGKTLIFNCHFNSEIDRPFIFPNSINEVASLDPPFASQMFEMSSIIPSTLLEDAVHLAKPKSVVFGAHGFVYNANPDILIKFLRWGTAQNVQI